MRGKCGKVERGRKFVCEEVQVLRGVAELGICDWGGGWEKRRRGGQ